MRVLENVLCRPCVSSPPLLTCLIDHCLPCRVGLTYIFFCLPVSLRPSAQCLQLARNPPLSSFASLLP